MKMDLNPLKIHVNPVYVIFIVTWGRGVLQALFQHGIEKLQCRPFVELQVNELKLHCTVPSKDLENSWILSKAFSKLVGGTLLFCSRTYLLRNCENKCDYQSV